MITDLKDEDRLGEIKEIGCGSVVIELFEGSKNSPMIYKFILCHTNRPGVFDVYKPYPTMVDYGTNKLYAESIGVFYQRMGEFINVMKLDEELRPEIGAYAFGID